MRPLITPEMNPVFGTLQNRASHWATATVSQRVAFGMEDDWNRRRCGAIEDADFKNKSFNISLKRKKKSFPDKSWRFQCGNVFISMTWTDSIHTKLDVTKDFQISEVEKYISACRCICYQDPVIFLHCTTKCKSWFTMLLHFTSFFFFFGSHPSSCCQNQSIYSFWYLCTARWRACLQLDVILSYQNLTSCSLSDTCWSFFYGCE